MTINLIPQTAQEAFDSVWNQLKTQQYRAFDGSTCMYRTHDGGRCAIGGMILDSEYDENIEGLTVEFLVNSGHVNTPVNRFFLCRLQCAHDTIGNWGDAFRPDEWFNQEGWDMLREIANEYDLTVPG